MTKLALGWWSKVNRIAESFYRECHLRDGSHGFIMLIDL